jgi:hypothetical protein
MDLFRERRTRIGTGTWAAGVALALLLGLLACGSTLKVDVGWDKNVDFSKYYTWAWKEDGSIKDPVWSKRCQSVLGDVLATKGLAPAPAGGNADLWVFVHARFSIDTQVVSYSPAWGYGWGGWAGSYDTAVYEIPVGSLLIDLVDANKKQLVWRGKASDVLQTGVSNEAREQKLTQVLTQMFATYPFVRQ